jgi:hypothetical protein
MTEICVYTNVTGGYERRLYKPRAQSRDVRFICFSDNPALATNGWELRDAIRPPGIARPDLVNRYHKLFAHRLLPEAACSIYIDANLQVTGDLVPLVDQLRRTNALLGAARHPERTSYLDEIDACLRNCKFKMDDEERVAAQKACYQQAGIPQAGLLAAGILVRRHGSAELDHAMTLWWNQIRAYTARDQISLPYVLWKTRLPHTVYDFNILRDNGYTSIHGHGQQPSPLQLVKRRLVRSLRSFARNG